MAADGLFHEVKRLLNQAESDMLELSQHLSVFGCHTSPLKIKTKHNHEINKKKIKKSDKIDETFDDIDQVIKAEEINNNSNVINDDENDTNRLPSLSPMKNHRKERNKNTINTKDDGLTLLSNFDGDESLSSYELNQQIMDIHSPISSSPTKLMKKKFNENDIRYALLSLSRLEITIESAASCMNDSLA